MRDEQVPVVRVVARASDRSTIWLRLKDPCVGAIDASEPHFRYDGLAQAAALLNRNPSSWPLGALDPTLSFGRTFLEAAKNVVAIDAGVVLTQEGATQPRVLCGGGERPIALSTEVVTRSICDSSVALTSAADTGDSDGIGSYSTLYGPITGPDVRIPLACALVSATGFTVEDLGVFAALARMAASAHDNWQHFFRLHYGLSEWTSDDSSLIVSDAICRDVERVAVGARSSRAPILTTGERGTGKEHIARVVHAGSSRSDGPFVTVDCAIQPPRLEVVLFGHAHGAFTGSRPVGNMERAHGGTLYLRRVDRMPRDLQIKLLAFLESGQVQRLESTWSTPVDVRVIAATSTNLAEAVRRGDFRSELHDRLKKRSLHIPPLRERREDIPKLVDCFLGRRRGEPAVAAETLDCLVGYDWPGNDRELTLVLECAALRASDQIILPKHLPLVSGENAGRHIPPAGAG